VHTPEFHIRDGLQNGLTAGGCTASDWPEKARHGRSTNRDDTAKTIAEFLNANVGFDVIDLSDVPAPGKYRDAVEFFKMLYTNYDHKVHLFSTASNDQFDKHRSHRES
jgi:hypothetical protein